MTYLKNFKMLITITIYFFTSIIMMSYNKVLYINIINPIFWSGILIYSFIKVRRQYIRTYVNKKYVIYMFLISCFYVIFYFYSGAIFGFIKSPYSHSLLSMIKNILIQVIPILGIEVARGLLVDKKSKIFNRIVTVLFIALQIDYFILINNLGHREQLFKYICSDILPLIALNILNTYLAVNFSYVIPLIYSAFKRIEILVLPILPKLNWFASGILNILFPSLIYYFYYFIFLKNKKVCQKGKMISKFSYSLVLILSISLACFMLGLFEYEPICILSNSMYPTFVRGDVVIFKKVNETQLESIPKNTIIVFSIDGQNIVHRIVDVIDENGYVCYKTKGDYNNTPDNGVVFANQIKGIYVCHIEHIGFPSIWLYEYLNNSQSKVEIK